MKDIKLETKIIIGLLAGILLILGGFGLRMYLSDAAHARAVAEKAAALEANRAATVAEIERLEKEKEYLGGMAEYTANKIALDRMRSALKDEIQTFYTDEINRQIKENKELAIKEIPRLEAAIKAYEAANPETKNIVEDALPR